MTFSSNKVFTMLENIGHHLWDALTSNVSKLQTDMVNLKNDIKTLKSDLHNLKK